jgi:hypothetical protein
MLLLTESKLNYRVVGVHVPWGTPPLPRVGILDLVVSWLSLDSVAP